jgi:trans-aconitate 2-methyltransferase
MPLEQWDPAVYVRRRAERARPFTELIARIGAEPGEVRDVVDVGCGPGYLTATLAHRYPRARVTGLDSSAAMIAEAEPLAGDSLRFAVGDATTWRPGPETDVVVSNAVLHWIPGHADLLRRWAEQLSPGAWLAVQVPGNHEAPSHVAVRALARQERWRDRLAGTDESGPVLDPAGYAALLAAAGCDVDAWETTYLHELPADDDARHPVLGWLEGTTLRPVIAALGPADAAPSPDGDGGDGYGAFAAELGTRLAADYPITGGRVWYPFRRVFAVARKRAGRAFTGSEQTEARRP